MTRATWRPLAALLLSLAAFACSRDGELLCDDTERYSTADSIPPVRIPDGLDPPDESESLRLPPERPGGEARGVRNGCLEAPPPFFEDRDPA